MSKPRPTRRLLQFKARTDNPFEVYLPSDPAVIELNKDSEDSQTTYVDETCTPFKICPLSYREREAIRDKVRGDFEGVSEEYRYLLDQMGVPEGVHYPSAQNIRKLNPLERVALKKAQRRNTLQAIAHSLAVVEAGFVGISGEETPEGGWAVLFHPDSDEPFEGELKVTLLYELSNLILEASELGPKAEAHFKLRYGSPMPDPVEVPVNLGDANAAPQKNVL